MPINVPAHHGAHPALMLSTAAWRPAALKLEHRVAKSLALLVVLAGPAALAAPEVHGVRAIAARSAATTTIIGPAAESGASPALIATSAGVIANDTNRLLVSVSTPGEVPFNGNGFTLVGTALVVAPHGALQRVVNVQAPELMGAAGIYTATLVVTLDYN